MVEIPDETEQYRITEMNKDDTRYGYELGIYDKEEDTHVITSTELKDQFDITWKEEAELMYAIKLFARVYYTGSEERDRDTALDAVEKAHT